MPTKKSDKRYIQNVTPLGASPKSTPNDIRKEVAHREGKGGRVQVVTAFNKDRSVSRHKGSAEQSGPIFTDAVGNTARFQPTQTWKREMGNSPHKKTPFEKHSEAGIKKSSYKK